jgi:glucose/arabinose dehydrogenase
VQRLAALVVAVALSACSQPGLGGASGSTHGVPTRAGGPAFALQALPDRFSAPDFVTYAGDGSDTLYVAEQAGRVLAVDALGATQPRLFLDLRDRVKSGGEQGLLGLAFHPGYGSNGRVFAYYTDLNGDEQVSEFHAGAGVADAGSERKLLHVDDPYPNHNGGMLAFGPDGMLYAGLGDGGAADDPGNRAQDLDTLLGKIVRVDVDSPPAPIPYAIPPDNPFASRPHGAEIWDDGLRNPWRFSWDRGAPDGAGRGDLWIGDVGQNAWEEVDREPAGGHGGVDYGWSRYEGTHLHEADRDAPGAVGPVAEYPHEDGACSVTGGYVYRGAGVPALQGAYLFGDYCTGVIWTLRPDGAGGYTRTKELDTPYHISSFGEDMDGELYVVDLGGQVLKVVPA